MAREYFDWQRHTRNRAREALFAYTDVLSKLLDWIGGTPLAAFSTRKRDVTVVRSFCKYLVERGNIGRNPAVLLSSPTVHNVNPRAINDDAWRAVWGSTCLEVGDRVALGLGYCCGLRRGQVVDLTSAHVERLAERLVGFHRKGGLDGIFTYGSAVA